jgi:hypothetical protein
MAGLCSCAEKLLGSGTSELGSSNVGSLISNMIFNMSSELGFDNINKLLQLSINKLHTCSLTASTESISLVFARLVHAQGAQFLQYLNSLGALEVEQKRPVYDNEVSSAGAKGKKKSKLPKVRFVTEKVRISALEFVFKKWLQIHEDIYYPYPIKVSISALANLLLQDSFVAHMMSFSTDGYPKVETDTDAEPDTGTGKRTSKRLQAREAAASTVGVVVESKQAESAGAIQFTQIPVPAKMLSVVIHEWLRQSDRKDKQGSGIDNDKEEFDDEDDDGEEEEDDADDDDDEKDNNTQGQNKSSRPSPFADYDEDGNYDKYMGSNLSDLLDFQEGYDDDDDNADQLQLQQFPEAATDPLDSLDVYDLLSNTIATLFQQQQQQQLKTQQQQQQRTAPNLSELASYLDVEEQKKLTAILSKLRLVQ